MYVHVDVVPYVWEAQIELQERLGVKMDASNRFGDCFQGGYSSYSRRKLQALNALVNVAKNWWEDLNLRLQ